MVERAARGDEAVPTGETATPNGAGADSRGFGLATATALIIGSIIGVGIFNLPTSLAAYGPISLVSMGLTTIGALALAMLFAALSRRLPADGGPYAYARVAYGNGYGFANAWSYWITAWAGNAAIAVFGILPNSKLANATAPFSDAVNAMFGGTAGGKIMSILVIISGIGALTGWTIICAEMPLAAAKDGLFPDRFKRMNKSDVPAFGIIASTSLASIAMIINYLGSSGANAFTTLVLMTGITAAIPYGFSALAQIKWRRANQRLLETPRFLRDLMVAILALVFSVLFIFYSRNTGHSFWLYWAPFFLAAAALALGIPVYNKQRGQMTEPAPVPPYPMPAGGDPSSPQAPDDVPPESPGGSGS